MFLLSSILAYIDRMVEQIENERRINTEIQQPNNKNVVVFDLDMTIGDFTFISGIYELCDIDGVESLDVFGRCFRPGIFHIFELLSIFKKGGVIDMVMIYTNNTGGKKWVNRIVKYIHDKLDIVLFDDIISAYEVNYGEEIDDRRTSMEKNIFEFRQIAKLESDDRIMFIDDMLHERMMNISVYYIHIQPYNMYYKDTDLEYIFRYNYKLSDNTKQLIMSKYKDYESNYIDMNQECIRMIEFTKLIANFTIRKKTGYTKL